MLLQFSGKNFSQLEKFIQNFLSFHKICYAIYRSSQIALCRVFQDELKEHVNTSVQ